MPWPAACWRARVMKMKPTPSSPSSSQVIGFFSLNHLNDDE